MADARQFAKLDLGYFDNPKVADFVDDQPRVPMLHLRAILYCRQHLTDGVFPARLVSRLIGATWCGSQCESQCDVCRAADAGLIERIDARSYLVHDYLEHQESAEDIQKRSAAGRKGAAARWSSESDADRNAKGNADRIPATNAKGNAEKRREEKSSSSGSRRKPETTLPEDWKPNTSHASLATEAGLSLSDESFRFRNHAVANDRRQRDWDAAFRTWLSRAKDYQPTKPRQLTEAQKRVPEGWL